MKRYNPKLIKEMEKDQDELRRVSIPEDEIFTHLVERYHPTDIELRRVRHPLAEFIKNPENERMLLSEIFYRTEKRLINKTQRLNQEVAAVPTLTPTIDGKEGIIQELHLIAGENTKAALSRAEKEINGWEEKKKRILDKRKRAKHFRDIARRTEQSIERRRSNWRNRGQGGSP